MMRILQCFAIWSVLVLILFSNIPSGYGQDGRVEVDLQHTTAVRLHEVDRFVKLENRVHLTYQARFSDHIRIRLNGLAVYDAVYDVENTLNVEDEKDYQAYIHMGEAFVDLELGQWDLCLGKQYEVWGQTTGFRVNDVVNPLDLREFVLADFLDSRIPLWMAKVHYRFPSSQTESALQFLIIPDMQFSELAHAGSEYAFALPEFPQIIIPVIKPAEKPERSFANTEYGVKFSHSRHELDFTLNYLYTWDDEPIYKLWFDNWTGTLIISPTHERSHLLGGTFATHLWKGIFRGELAAKIGKYFSVLDYNVPNRTVKKTLLSYALAFERKLFDTSWMFQVLQDRILDYDNTIILYTDVDTKLTLNVSKNFKYETLNVALLLAYGANKGDFLIRPSVEYKINDSTKIKTGVDLFEGGDDHSFFGQFHGKDRLYVELYYNF